MHPKSEYLALNCHAGLFVQVPEECPASIAALIKECMSGQPDKRPTAKEIFDRMQVRFLVRCTAVQEHECVRRSKPTPLQL